MQCYQMHPRIHVVISECPACHLLAPLEPRARTLHSECTHRALALFEALQLLRRRQQRPRLATDEPHVGAAARDRGLEDKPALHRRPRLRRLALELPATGPRRQHCALDHLRDGLSAFGGEEVPREADEISPEALGREQRRGSCRIAARQRAIQGRHPLFHLHGRRKDSRRRHRRVSRARAVVLRGRGTRSVPLRCSHSMAH